MGLLLFFLLIFIAALAALAYTLIVGWNSRLFIAALVAFALLLTLPTILPRLIGA